MRDILDSTPLWYKLMLIFNAVLIVVSFILPPQGIVDPSVLTAVGEMGGFSLLGLIPHYLKVAKSVKVAKGDASIEVESKEKKS